MSRIPMPKASLLLVALGGALLFGHEVTGPDTAAETTESAVVYTVPAASAHSFAADLHVDDAASATLR